MNVPTRDSLINRSGGTWSEFRHAAVEAFHDADTDTDILARMSVSAHVGVMEFQLNVAITDPVLLFTVPHPWFGILTIFEYERPDILS